MVSMIQRFGLVTRVKCSLVLALALFLVGGSLLAVPHSASAQGVEAAASIRYLDCRSLAGTGSYSDPKRVGAITQTTIVTNCPPLTSGSGFNVRYFSFALNQRPTAQSYVMTYYQRSSSAESGVHPRLAWGAITVKNSLSAKYYRSGSLEAFYHTMGDLWAGGSWRLGAEKLSSPLGSLRTAPYNIAFVP